MSRAGGDPSPDHASGTAPPLSVLAVVAFVLAVVPCCPPSSLLGAMLGIVAIRRIDTGRAMRGRRLALAAVMAGLVLTLMSTVAWSRFSQAHDERTRRSAMTALEQVIGSAARGQTEKTRAAWSERGDTRPPVEQIERFGATVRERYGGLQGIKVVSIDSAGSFLAPQLEMAVTYSFDSEKCTGSAAFDLVVVPGALTPVFRVRELTIDDAERGALQLPSDQAPP